VSVAIYLVLRTIALSGTLGLDLEPENLATRLFPNLAIVPKYLGLILWPVGLSAVRMPPAGGFPISVWTFASWVAIAGSIFFLWRTERPPTRLGLLWFAVNYIPISNLVFTPSAPVAERFLYLPAIGIWWIVADQLAWIHERTTAKRFVQLIAAAAFVTLACLSAARNLDWRSSISLFAHEAKINPSVADHHYNLCTAYFEGGELPSAEAACVRADQLGPGNPEVLIQLGNLWQPGVALHHYLALQHSLPADHELRADVQSRLRNIAERLQAVP